VEEGEEDCYDEPEAVRVLSVSGLQEDLGSCKPRSAADLGFNLGIFDVGVSVRSENLKERRGHAFGQDVSADQRGEKGEEMSWGSQMYLGDAEVYQSIENPSEMLNLVSMRMEALLEGVEAALEVVYLKRRSTKKERESKGVISQLTSQSRNVLHCPSTYTESSRL
jgi:hypothetical protein